MSEYQLNAILRRLGLRSAEQLIILIAPAFSKQSRDSLPSAKILKAVISECNCTLAGAVRYLSEFWDSQSEPLTRNSEV
ncbi:hypothetical protein [Biformimicrobium ophioploci]|uniref:Uncharacterized protein n=1 Tax=Biformimicrobium ophioploci TaxID=3036711 RepID=A0ABQ6LY51_9GAMM|nr:hypothetical protein [Microbulbifer sp. NKW57]GMG86977.1 hypothetical protein MNKW57_12980 [Microbulbifer sp. NKW57]